MGRERETRTQRAEAISGRAAQRVHREHRQQTGGGEAPRPPMRRPRASSAEIPPQKKRSRGRAYKVPAQAAPAILRTQSAQAIQAEADKERGPRSGPRSETRLSLYQQPRSTGQAARLYSPTGPARQP